MDDDFYWYILFRMVLHSQPTGFHKRRVRISADVCPCLLQPLAMQTPNTSNPTRVYAKLQALGSFHLQWEKLKPPQKQGAKPAFPKQDCEISSTKGSAASPNWSSVSRAAGPWAQPASLWGLPPPLEGFPSSAEQLTAGSTFVHDPNMSSALFATVIWANPDLVQVHMPKSKKKSFILGCSVGGWTNWNRSTTTYWTSTLIGLHRHPKESIGGNCHHLSQPFRKQLCLTVVHWPWLAAISCTKQNIIDQYLQRYKAILLSLISLTIIGYDYSMHDHHWWTLVDRCCAHI